MLSGIAAFQLGELEQRSPSSAPDRRVRERGSITRRTSSAEFVAHVGDQRQLLVVDQFGDASRPAAIFCTSQGISVITTCQVPRPASSVCPARAHPERAAAGGIGLRDGLGRIDDDAAGRKIRTRDVFQQRAAARVRAGRSDAARRRTVRRHCAAGSRSPCRPRCPASRWRAGWETPPAAPPALSTSRHSWRGNRPRPRRCRRAAAARPRSAAPRCSGRRPALSPSILPKLPWPSTSG